MATPQWCFGDFRLDPDRACLWRGTQSVALTPKAFAVLHYLVTHPDRLVSKEALLDAVWPETAVSDVVVRIAIAELRRALGDTAQGARYIVTVSRRGYRFVVPVVAYREADSSPIETPSIEMPDTLPPPPVAPQPPAVAPAVAERRHLTVLFCDLVRSTALASRLDPEDYREVVHGYHQCCAEVIQQFEGYVAQYLGDGVLVYFGYPVAHEDDAQRAVRAGLGLLEACARLATHPVLPPGEPLAVRVGIHTGLVVVGVVGAGSHHEPLALGETPNIAARLQALAEPNTLVLSATTQQLVAGYFQCKSVGMHTLHELSQPLEVYRVLAPSGMRSRLEVAALHGLTPLVGRDQEVGLLQACWTRVTTGRGQVVLLEGEAGIGKSRLVQVLSTQVAAAGYTWLEGQGSPYYQHTAFYPLTELLARRLLPLEPTATAAQRVQSLEAFLAQHGLSPAETVPLLAPLLSLPLPATYAPLPVSPEQQRQQTLQALLRLVLCLAVAQPLLLILEDLHWIDPSTLEWLSLLVDQGPTPRMLTLCTTRPDYSPRWRGRSHCTQITLARLPQEQATALTHQVAQGKTLPVELVAQIVAKTDGVPLFVEEVTKTVLESGLPQEREGHAVRSGALPTLAIPVTLHDALLARLDRMGTAKSLAQLGATLGREFSYTLLRAMSVDAEETVQQELQQLVAAEVLYQRGLPPQATYVFKHALIQDIAYQSLLKRTRQHYHQHIVQVLERHFPDVGESQPELLAHHCTEAGLQEHAVRYWQQAGERALQRSANLEAVQHLTRGLQVLATLPETPLRHQQELALQLSLGPALIATQGYSAPVVESTYHQALALCQHLGDTPQLFPALAGLFIFYLIRGELHTAQQLSARGLQVAQEAQDPLLTADAYTAQGMVAYYRGDFAAAHAHCTQGLTLYTLAPHRPPVVLFQDTQHACLTFAALTLWSLGYPEQALARNAEALATARQLAHPYTLAWSLDVAARVHQFRREERLTQEWAEATIAGAIEYGFPFSRADGALLRGWALAAQGHHEEGLLQMQHGLAASRAIGNGVMLSYWLGLLTAGYRYAGRIAEGLALLEEALAVVDDTGQRFYAAELYRLQGELQLRDATPNEHQAEVCLRQALEIAQQQQAKSFELRAVMSLARLWQQQRKRAEAYALLAPLYGWFREGFETVDLQEARELLDTLRLASVPAHG